MMMRTNGRAFSPVRLGHRLSYINAIQYSLKVVAFYPTAMSALVRAVRDHSWSVVVYQDTSEGRVFHASGQIMVFAVPTYEIGWMMNNVV